MKVLRSILLVFILLSFQNCTSWPALFLALFGGGDKGGGLIFIPAGGEEGSTTPPVPGQPDPGQVTEGSVIPPTPGSVHFSITASNVNESESEVKIPVLLNGTQNSLVTVDYEVTGGSAEKGVDYTLANGTLSFQPGETTQDISIALVNDLLPEANETIEITLSNVVGGSLGTSKVYILTIVDDDSPNVSFSSTGSSGAESVTNVTIPVTLSMSSGAIVTVDFNVTGGTATNGSDYTFTAGTLTFNPGETTKNIAFNVVNDTLHENNETIVIALTNPARANLGVNDIYTYTINDNDSPPSVRFLTAASNGSESTTSVNIPVELSAVSALPVTVNYAVTGGSATGGGVDFTLTSGTLNFAAGETAKNIPITILNDALYETNESIVITLSDPSGASLGTSSHTYTINDDDLAPNVAFESISADGLESLGSVTIPVSLSNPSGLPVTVDYSLSGTATAGVDYTLSAGTLSFAVGETTKNINLLIIDDSLNENPETIILTLSNGVNASLAGTTQFTYTILDNDAAPTVSFTQPNSQGEENLTAVNLSVQLSSASGKTVSVDYSVTGGTAGVGVDYILNSGTLVFNPGELSKEIPLTIINDTSTELNETVIVSLSNPQETSLGTNPAHTYTILDNDSPSVAFNAISGNGSESVTSVNIPVQLSAAFGSSVSVGYSVTGGTASPDVDFTLASGSLSFSPGETEKNITLSVINDSLNEPNETVIITLAGPTGASLGSNQTYTYTIGDDDPEPSVNFSSLASSGQESGGTVNIPVTLSSASGKTVTVNYSVTGGSATGGGDDYTLGAGSLSFAAGETTKNITLSVVNDTKDEENETVEITLATPGNASLGTNIVHTYTIEDDDSAPSIGFETISGNGSETTTSVNIPVSLSGASGKTVTVNYSVTGGTATSGEDFNLSSGTLTFNPGVTTQNINLAILNDSLYEDDESVIIALSSPSNSILGANDNYTYTINDNDTAPTLAFVLTSSSGSESIGTANFEVQLSSATGKTITVDYSVVGVTAQVGTDFNLNNGVLSFSPGITSRSIAASIVNDAINEGAETFTVTLSNPTNATLGANVVHTYTIDDDDPLPSVSFGLATSSGAESIGTMNIALNLSAESGQEVSVIVNDVTGLGAGLGLSGVDYTPIGSPLLVTFAPGVTTQNIEIPVVQDLDYEGNENILLSLSTPTNANLGAQTNHSFTILDDDIGVVSAETMDVDGNGQIDHYKLTFSEPVQDSSFPGYVFNSLGSAQANWRIGGTSVGVVLSHGSAESVLGDIPNDEILYLKFNESGIYDTDSKPEVTTNANPSLLAMSGKTVSNIYTATVTELDRARPIIVSASGSTSGNLLLVTFSEPVWGTPGMPACGVGGDLSATSLTYNDTSGDGSSSIIGMGADSCASDSTVAFTVNNNFLLSDNNVDSIVPGSNLYDAANNSGNPIARKVLITNPVITNVYQYDTNGNGRIDQIQIVFSMNLNDSTITNVDAAQFSVGGIPAIAIDTASGGTGIISGANTDPGIANDNIVTIFTNDSSLQGTDLKTISFNSISGKWQASNGVEVQTIASLASVTADKAPPVLLSAVASDNVSLVAGVDGDDTLVLSFSEPTNKPDLFTANLPSVFGLNNGHEWGAISGATWNANGDVLTLVFAGSGSTVAVGDIITILGTVSDLAMSSNLSVGLPAVNPITGTFYTIDTSTPTVSSATSVDTNTVRLTYSKTMNGAEALLLGNYKILAAPASGACGDNSNFTGGTSALNITNVTQVDGKTFDLSTDAQLAMSYTVVVNKSGVNDMQPVNLNCPNNADFAGNENIKTSQAVCASTTEVILTFSKPVKIGFNQSGSAECDSPTECAKRYYITPPTTGQITSARKLDGIICGAAPISDSKICITHSVAQGGGNYTIIAANAQDGDGFDNSSFGAIQNAIGTPANLQNAPRDRVSFSGCGAGIHNFADGPISTDPFGDSAYFGYVMGYFNKVYVGPNTKGNAASRFNPDGSNPETMSFEFTKDSTTVNSSGTSSNTATTRDGGIAVPPYVTIGHTGCTQNSANLLTGCGPNNEDGRGLFVSGVMGGTEYLFITGGRSAGNGDYLYYTSDTDTALNFNYLDAAATFNSNSIAGNRGTESIIVAGGKIYWMPPGDRAARPYLIKINNLAQNQVNNTDSVFMNIRYMAGFGGASTASPNRADKIGGTLHEFNDRIYLANSGSNSFDGATCDAGSQASVDFKGSIKVGRIYSTNPNRRNITDLADTSDLEVGMLISGSGIPAGTTIASIVDSTSITTSANSTTSGTRTMGFYKGCGQMGGIIRSASNDPGTCTSTDTCPGWVDISPTSDKYRKNFSTVLLKLADLIPSERPIPGFANFHSKVYMIRNACLTRVQSRSCNTGNVCSDDVACPAGNEIPQLWKCDPTNGGLDTTNPSTCESNEWILVAENGLSAKTNMGDDTNKKISILLKSGSRLYVGYDNPTTGFQMWRTKAGTTDPSNESDFEIIGSYGFGDSDNNLELYSAVSLEQAGSYYIYVSGGRPGLPVQPLRVYRQVNDGPLATLFEERPNTLIAFLHQAGDRGFKLPFLILIFSIVGFFGIRKFLKYRKEKLESEE